MTLRATAAMKQAATESQAALRVDHTRHTERERAQEAAARARAARVVAVPCDDEAGARLMLRCMAREVHARIVLTEGQHAADNLFASIARKGAEVPNLRKAGARAEAERVFGRAANDHEEES